MSICKLLKRLVPRAGVEPAPSYEERILSPLRGYLPHSTTRYQAVFTDVSAVKQLTYGLVPAHNPLIFVGQRARSQGIKPELLLVELEL